jgi:hypothetical protein
VADNVEVPLPDGTTTNVPVATDEIAGKHYQRVKATFGVDGVATDVSASDPLPVTGTVTTGGLTDTQLRATAVPVSGTVTATGPLTDAQLRATAVPISGTVTTGGLTDAQLRASRVPVDGSGVTQPVSIAARVTASFPTAASAVVVSLTTNATGTTYTAFSSQACTALDLVNNTGTTLEVRRGGSGSTIPVPTGSARLFVGITNASDLQVRRADTSNTQVTVTAEALS